MDSLLNVNNLPAPVHYTPKPSDDVKHGPCSVLQEQMIKAKDEFPDMSETAWPEDFTTWLTYLLLLVHFSLYIVLYNVLNYCIYKLYLNVSQWSTIMIV